MAERRTTERRKTAREQRVDGTRFEVERLEPLLETIGQRVVALEQDGHELRREFASTEFMSSECTVLVVEDHNDSRQMLVEFLSAAGFRVEAAADGASALAQARLTKPHVVLMDLSMPGEFTGWDAIRQLKADPSTKDTIIVAVTGWSGAPAHDRAKHAGAHEVILKPVDLDALLEQVRQLCASPSETT